MHSQSITLKLSKSLRWSVFYCFKQNEMPLSVCRSSDGCVYFFKTSKLLRRNCRPCNTKAYGHKGKFLNTHETWQRNMITNAMLWVIFNLKSIHCLRLRDYKWVVIDNTIVCVNKSKNWINVNLSLFVLIHEIIE